MAKQAKKAKADQANAVAATFEIAQDQWTTFFADLTRDYRGAHGRLEILSEGVGYQVETENRPFDGVSADVKGGEHNVWITFGSTLGDHLAHGVHNVIVIRWRPPLVEAGAALEVEAKDRTRTLLELSRPEAYALSPASTRETATRPPGSRA